MGWRDRDLESQYAIEFIIGGGKNLSAFLAEWDEGGMLYCHLMALHSFVTANRKKYNLQLIAWIVVLLS